MIGLIPPLLFYSNFMGESKSTVKTSTSTPPSPYQWGRGPNRHEWRKLVKQLGKQGALEYMRRLGFELITK